MMYFEEINSHLGLYLAVLLEQDDYKLVFTIEEAREADVTTDHDLVGIKLKDVREIVSTEVCSAYKITFNNYIAYMILNESFSKNNPQEEFEGKIFRVFSKSSFLSYLETSSTASDFYPGPFRHYEFVCLNHIVDIVSTEAPEIKKVRGKGKEERQKK